MAAPVVKRITEVGLRKKFRDYIYLDLYKWLESGRSAVMSVNKVVHREAKKSLTEGSVGRSRGQARKQDHHHRQHSNPSLAIHAHQFHE